VGRAPSARARGCQLVALAHQAGSSPTAQRANLGSVFERFTERARWVVVLAQEEARTLAHNHIGSEHILLGLVREDEGLAGRVLGSMGVTVAAVRADVVRIVGGAGEQAVRSGRVPFTPEAKRVFELALREALRLGHNYIGTEHLLLSLVAESDSVGARVLLDLDADGQTVRDEVLLMLASHRPPAHAGDRGWLDFTPSEAFDLATRLVPVAEEIKFEVRRDTPDEPTFRVSCRLAEDDDALRELVALEAIGVRAILDRGRSIRLGRLEPGETDSAGA